MALPLKKRLRAFQGKHQTNRQAKFIRVAEMPPLATVERWRRLGLSAFADHPACIYGYPELAHIQREGLGADLAVGLPHKAPTLRYIRMERSHARSHLLGLGGDLSRDRFMAPLSTTWREWTRAGLLQAFIIAFYAEMYGFLLTIYVLTRLFKLDVAGTSLWDGNLWTYVTGSPQVMLISMIIGYSIAVFGILLLAASWRELYRATKERRLATGGPYAFVRRPQYAGLFLAVFGEGVVHWPTVFSLVAFVVIVLAYLMLARKEEREMSRKFGPEYLQYKRSRPMFFPRREDWRELARRIFRPAER